MKKIPKCGITKKVRMFGDDFYYVKMCNGEEHLFRESEMETSANRFTRAKEGMRVVKEVKGKI